MGSDAESTVRQWQDLVVAACAGSSVPPSLVLGLMLVESGGQARIESRVMNYDTAGRPIGRAQGLLQVLPFHWGIRPGPDGELSEEEKAFCQDPERNIAKGVELLAAAYRTWGSWEKALARYFGALDSTGAIRDWADATGVSGRLYVRLVLAARARFLDVDAVASSSPAGGPADPAPADAAGPLPAERFIPYTVRPGDTLWAIGRRFGLTPHQIQADNADAIIDIDRIYAGQVLRIRQPRANAVYVVQPGDTLWAIAAQHGLSLRDLIARNPQIENPDLIYPGDRVFV